MLEAISTGVTTLIGYAGDVINAITGTSGDLAALLPVLGLGIAVAFVSVAIGFITRLVRGM